jgi:hypothetical protein
MFMSTDKSRHLASQEELVDFILDKESCALPSRFKVYLYTTLSKYKRMIGPCVANDPFLGIQKWSEINFQPLFFQRCSAQSNQVLHCLPSTFAAILQKYHCPMFFKHFYFSGFVFHDMPRYRYA